MSRTLETAIKAYLDEMAQKDEAFALSYKKEKKSLKECCDYIMSEAYKRGSSVCMTDDEVYGLAMHYYDEDEIDFRKVPTNATAKVSAKPAVNLTEEEKAEAKQQALKEYKEQERRKLEAEIKAKKEKAAEAKKQAKAEAEKYKQLSLFD